MKNLWAIIGIALLLCFYSSCAQGTDTAKYEWEVVASFGVVTTVYMSSDAFADHKFIAQVLKKLRTNAPIQQIWFFDDKAYTATRAPMTDDQLLHNRASYGINTNTGYEKYWFSTVKDPKVSPPELVDTPADIRPGYPK